MGSGAMQSTCRHPLWRTGQDTFAPARPTPILGHFVSLSEANIGVDQFIVLSIAIASTRAAGSETLIWTGMKAHPKKIVQFMRSA